MGCEPSRADQDRWIKKSSHYEGYHIATHADDIIIMAKNPLKYMSHIEQHFQHCKKKLQGGDLNKEVFEGSIEKVSG
eukprot:5197187-Ditylum_brightwellii.AAC.1